MKKDFYDLAVIGAGSGGLAAAFRAAKHGLSVAIIDNKEIGGTCVNRGCVPKKLLWYAAENMGILSHSHKLGIEVSENSFDWSSLLNNANESISRINKSYLDKLEKNNITFIEGLAKLKDNTSLLLGNKEISFKNLIIATGTRSTKLDIPGAEYCLVSDDIFKLKSLPKSIIIIGAGYIAIEMACILNKLGVNVTIIYRGDRILKNFDYESTKALHEQMVSDGIKIIINTEIDKVEKTGSQLKLALKDKGHLTVDSVLFATGRVPNLECLKGSSVHLQSDNGYIDVNGDYRTNIDNIFAVGDCINTKHLTPVAKIEGEIAVDNILGLNSKVINYNNIPSTVFSLPPYSSVGYTPNRAEDKYGIYNISFTDLKSSITQNNQKSHIKLIFNKDDNKLIGAHLLCDNSHEMIQVLAIAIEAGVTKDDFVNTVPLHPTIAEELIYSLKQ